MRHVPILILLFAGLHARPARADADALIDQGVELRRAGRDAEALAKFQEALAESGSARARGQVALAHQALGQWLDAERELAAALEQGGPWIEKNREPLERALGTIRSNLGSIVILGSPEGAAVELDGRSVGSLPLNGPVRVLPGDVRLRVTADGYAPGGRKVRVRKGQTVSVKFELKPAGAAPSAPQPEPAAPEDGSYFFGVGPRGALEVEAGFSTLPSVAYVARLGPKVALGIKAGLDISLFGSAGSTFLSEPFLQAGVEPVPDGGTLTAFGAVPVRFVFAESRRFTMRFALAPGAGYNQIDLFAAFEDPSEGDGVVDFLAVLAHASLDAGFDATPWLTVGGGVEVPTTIFVKVGDIDEFELNVNQFIVVPILIGPKVEARLAPGVAVGLKARFGPHLTFYSYDEDAGLPSDVSTLALQVQAGAAFSF